GRGRLRGRRPLLAGHAARSRRTRRGARIRSASVRGDRRVGIGGRLLRRRPRVDAHGFGELALVGRRCARWLPTFLRDRLAPLQLVDPRLHRDRGDGRLHQAPRQHRAHRSRGRAARRHLMTVTVLQAGPWGTTLATILARDGGKDVVLWVRDPAQAKEIATRRENRKYLAGIRVPDRVEVPADLERALASDDLIVAAPSRGVRELRDRMSPLLRKGHRVLSATKGLADDGRRMSQLWAEALAPDRVAVLSGPNISREIAAGLPAPTVISSGDAATARHFQSVVGTPMFRVYTNADVVGVELCGALK